jgi:hypothetical protein
MIKKVLVALAASAFLGVTAQAAGINGATLSKDKRVTSVAHGSSVYTPARMPVGAHKLIWSNVGYKYPNGLYFCCYGNTISGSGSVVGATFWLAASFTPAADATVKEIDAGVGWVTGTNKVIVTLYDDNGGVPGKTLASGAATGLNTFGTCCGLAILDNHVKVMGGSTYWVSVTTDGAGSDTWAAWNFNSTDQINPVSVATSDGTTWTNVGGEVPSPSFAIIGR